MTTDKSNGGSFLTVVFTAPGSVDDEDGKIVRLLDAGVDRIHIRKPALSREIVEKLISAIPAPYRPRLTVHDHFQIVSESGIGGIHLNRRNPEPVDARFVSKSLHSLSELEEAERYDYVTLSPIFDSISKSGYMSGFDLDSLGEHIRGKRVVALGGVTPGHFLMLREKGFHGAGLLGYIWNGDFDSVLSELSHSIEELKNIKR